MTDEHGGCRIYPEELSAEYLNDPRRRAEVQVYKQLRRQLGSEWTVFYDVAWFAPVYPADAPQDGQTDFVVYHPDRGILLIEVKGGNIRFDGKQQQWYSRDAQGIEHKISPIAQVVKSKHALLDKLRSLPALKGIYINIFHSVAFPDVQVPRDTPFDAPRDLLIGCDDMQYLLEKIESIFTYCKPKAQKCSNPSLLQDELVTLLARSHYFRSPLSIQCNRDSEEILRLTEAQFNLFDGLSRCRRVSVKGCAGSGKTFLAVEKANRLAAEGYRTLLTCYNRPLADFLMSVAQKNDNLMVESFLSVCWLIARDKGRTLPTFQKGQNNQGLNELYAQTIRELMQSNPELRFDAIIVDEAQDFEKYWWPAVEECLSGPNGILYVFYDDNQVLYKDRGVFLDRMVPYSLSHNIRNSRQIFELVNPYYRSDDGEPMQSRGPLGTDVEKFTYKTEDEMRSSLFDTINRWVVDEHIPTSDMVVLTPKSLDKSALMKQGKGPQYKLVERKTTSKNEILCSTIHSFKGLEKEFVAVTELDESLLKHPHDRANKFYVAFSRAKNHLAVFAKDAVWKELDHTQDQ
jgi:hypothetical protein